MSDKGRRYQTFNRSNKTKTEINTEYYFKYIKLREQKPDWFFKNEIPEDIFFNTDQLELSRILFQN